jgi:SAM-dependent methyltransferase
MRKLLFDEPYYIEINEARWAVAERVLKHIRSKGEIALQTCLDVGCGPGWFSERISKMGIAVTGLEGRRELIDMAVQRCPQAKFKHLDLEEPDQLQDLSPADMVFCFGLLYHVENPFKLLRRLYALAGHILFIESIVVPSDYPCAWLVEEGKNETQGLSHHSFILSRPALIGILQRVGFPFVYRYHGVVMHPDFMESEGLHPRRGIFLASKVQLSIDSFQSDSPILLPKFDFSKKVIIG